MKDNMVTVLTMMSLVLTFDALVGGKLFLKLGGVLSRLSLAALIFTVALAAKSDWLAEILSNRMWPITVLNAAAIVLIVLCDFMRLKKRLDRAATRRCHRYHRNNRGSRRTTPVKH